MVTDNNSRMHVDPLFAIGSKGLWPGSLTTMERLTNLVRVQHLVEDKITADSSCPGNMAHVIVQT